MKEERFAVIDVKNGDQFESWFDNKEEALTEAEKQWGYLTEAEKKNRDAFYVLESANPDPDADDHFDGDVVKEWC